MKKPKQKVAQTEDSIEAFKGLPGEFKKTIAAEGKNLIADLWKQTLRPSDAPQNEGRKPEQAQKAGDLKPGEEVNFKEEKKLQHIEPGIDYSREIIHAERKVRVEGEHQNKARIQEILIEIKKITKSSKELAIEFKDVEKMEQIPQGAGKYHTNFVEWVLSMLRSARERVDNAVSWTAALKSKKSQKQYWALFKKHGTSFGLSAERYAVTQVG